MSSNAGLTAPYVQEQGHLMIWPSEHRPVGGWRLHWLTRTVPRDPEPCASSNAMTGACLTVNQVQSIPWSVAPSSTRLLLVTSAFVTAIVTRGNAAKPCAIRAAAVVEVPVCFQRKGRAQVGARFGQADRLLQGSEVCVAGARGPYV